jgi:FkbM family methyltransferase
MKDKVFNMRMNQKQFNLLRILAKSKNFTMSNYMLEFLYKETNHDYTIGVFSDIDDKEIIFYKNDFEPGGNSYYRELAFDNGKFFPETNYIVKKTRTLDSIVSEKNYRYPDLIKIDVQGAELDVLKGATNVLQKAEYLIVELQHVNYNKDAPLANTTIDYLKSIGWECIAEKFSDNGPDADYCFKNTFSK